MQLPANILFAALLAIATAHLTNAQPTPPSIPADWTFHSGQANAQAGHSITGVGDINGDGFDDVVGVQAIVNRILNP